MTRNKMKIMAYILVHVLVMCCCGSIGNISSKAQQHYDYAVDDYYELDDVIKSLPAGSDVTIMIREDFDCDFLDPSKEQYTTLQYTIDFNDISVYFITENNVNMDIEQMSIEGYGSYIEFSPQINFKSSWCNSLTIGTYSSKEFNTVVINGDVCGEPELWNWSAIQGTVPLGSYYRGGGLIVCDANVIVNGDIYSGKNGIGLSTYCNGSVIVNGDVYVEDGGVVNGCGVRTFDSSVVTVYGNIYGGDIVQGEYYSDDRDIDCHGVWARDNSTVYCSGQVLSGKVYNGEKYDNIKLTESAKFYNIDEKASGYGVGVRYTTHVQSYGWKDMSYNGESSGTTGQGKRLESVVINLYGNDNLSIRYRTHVQSYGWMHWVPEGGVSGTSGESKRLEAICIELTGSDKDKYDIFYRVHAQGYGWLGWAENGQPAGTAGQGKRLEAIEIKVLPKGTIPAGVVGYSYVELGKSANNSAYAGKINYQTHVQSYGNQSYVYDGSVSGTFGEAKRLEGIKINVNNDLTGVSGGITYRTHVQSYGWLDWVSDGQFSGTAGESKRLEAIEIKLTGDMEKYHDVYYRVHSQTFGWLGWAKNGEPAGTAGYAKRLEGIQVVILLKGSQAPNNLPASNGIAAYISK